MSNNKFKITLAWLVCLIGVLAVDACKKEDEIDADKTLYDMAKATNGFVWFKKSNTLLPKSGGSGHPQPFLKTRYNAIAATRLDTAGRIMANAVFPEGALIVKELYENATTLGRYAILYKKSDDPNADAKGWVWSYINADGSVAFSATKKGDGCISCHSQTNNVDYMLMNKYFQ